MSKTLTIRSSPHVAARASVDAIMFHVVLALLPACVYAVVTFGVAALLLLITAVVSCVATEHLFCRIGNQNSTIGDWSAVITGMLYGMVLPANLPLWMVAFGGIVSIGLGKMVFGGLGRNPFNPALVGRAVLQATFPLAMTTWPDRSHFFFLPPSTLTLPFASPAYDAVSGATPLADWKFNQELTSSFELLIGATTGSTGETSSLLILVGGVYLIWLKLIDWRIPASILLTVILGSGILHLIDSSRFADPVFMLLSGGLMLGAVFMATDLVGSPMTHWGVTLYGVLIGMLVIVIRVWGGMPEGVMYAILLGNAATPLIDDWFQPKLFGTQKRGTQQ